MRISIIVPIYNVEKYLQECLESIIKQSYKDIEIILVNDGSTDSSGEICKNYSERYKNIVYLEKVNGGLSDTRNFGIEKSTGDYLIFIDSDDYWNSNFLAELNNIVEKNDNLDIVFFRFVKYYENSKRKEEEVLNIDFYKVNNKTGIEAINHILLNNKDFGWYACRYLVSRQYIIENNMKFIKGRSYEDALWSPKVWIKASKVYYYDEAVYVYRLDREGQITSNISLKNLKDSIFVSTYWLEEIKKYYLDEILRKKILKNVTVRYFYAIWFAWKLDRNHREEIYKLIDDNKELLKYKNSNREKITSLIIKVFGVKLGCNIFKYIKILKNIIWSKK